MIGADHQFMQLALDQAQAALRCGEVPVGAVVVKDGVVVAAGHNTSVSQTDPTGHAEVVALRAAAKVLGSHRLDGCTMYVTLEPCAMCSGAVLHARLDRLVYGAPDPKTGAAGSVINVFANAQLNHHTAVQGGVLGDACAAVLRNFFAELREQKAAEKVGVREDALRTPESRFDALPSYPWAPHYRSDLSPVAGLRLHYLDEGDTDAPLTFLCLHGNPGWSYLYRKMIPIWTRAGHRVVAPDLMGFGKSDKPKREDFHSFDLHRSYLLDFVEKLALERVVLVVQDWGGLLGLTLPMAAPQRYCGLLVMNTWLATGEVPLPPGFLDWRSMCERKPDFDVGRLFGRGNPHLSAAECAAYDAPFPDAGHRAALRAFPRLVPQHPASPGAAVSREAARFWSTQWQGRSLMAVGAQDPVFGREVMQGLRRTVRGCPEPLVLPEAGHFVQEHGQAVAQAALAVFHSG